ncbi:MAG: DUF6880 family protein [Leptolyngbyaceae cyanobacterium]
MATLSDILDSELLETLAGHRFYERGVNYFHQGRVHALAQDGDHITAAVSGTATYQVHLWLDEHDDLQSDCSCPMGVAGYFCKHCVAVGLVWIAEPPPYRPPSGTATAPRATTMTDVRDYLSQQSHETLVQLIVDQAMNDPRWREQLLMKVAAQQVGGADISTFRRSLRDAIAIQDVSTYIGYREAYDYADEISSVIRGLEELLERGYANEVVELCEEAIALIEEAYNSIDDSSGSVGGVACDIQDLHYRACVAGQPDLTKLATSIFHLEINSDYGIFDSSVEKYADILGKTGLQAYEKLLDTALAEELAAKNRSDGGYSYRYSQLRRTKERLVEASGTVEDLVNTIAQDLSQPSRYLKIAQIYRHNGEGDEAIAWAEKGLAAFSDHPRTGQLGDFLITEYEKQGRLDDALAIVWRDLQRVPSITVYQQLKQQADQLGTWDHWHRQALDHIRQVIQKSPDSPGRNRIHRANTGLTDYSLLVEIFLWEGDVDQAWQEAKTGGCRGKLWMELAAAREADHPADAVAVYQPRVEPLIKQKNNEAYKQAVELIATIKTLMIRLDQKAEFKQWLADLRATHNRKRNFMRFLNDKGLRG